MACKKQFGVTQTAQGMVMPQEKILSPKKILSTSKEWLLHATPHPLERKPHSSIIKLAQCPSRKQDDF